MSDLLKKAIRGDASAAALLWRGIADKTVSDADALIWVRSIAPDVVSDVLDSTDEANRRSENARGAIGLNGRIDPHYKFRESIPMYDGMPAKKAAEISILIDETPTTDVGKLTKLIENTRYKKRK